MSDFGLPSGSTALIIGVADSIHYLVGAIDAHNNFGAIGGGDVAVVGSLAEAKQYLCNQNIFSAEVEYQSAYDEFCDGSNAGACRQTINF